MSGEGALSNTYGFDIRRDGFEATRTSALPVVAGRREVDGWAVWLSMAGLSVPLEPARARQLAQDIADICDVIEGRHAVQGGQS